jgi:hypothetical protein
MKGKVMKFLTSVFVLLIFCFSCESNNEGFIKKQIALADEGNYWAKYELWQAYSKGKYGITKNQNKADELIADLTKDVYLVSFESSGDFNPQNAKELLNNFNDNSSLRSEKDKIGGASFFRTKAMDNRLIGSFLTAYPVKLQEDIENNPNLKFVSVEKINPEMFIEYESSIQESIN